MNLNADLSTFEANDNSRVRRIYTTGYANKDIAHLPALLSSLNALLIDIRFVPGGNQIQWRKDYLKLLLKDRYRHVSHLGNRPSDRSGSAAIQNLNLGVKIITELKFNLLLMCECQNKSNCHRSIISEKLGEQGIETVEIIDWVAKI